MSEQLPVVLSLAAAHKAAIDDANRWRGHCIEKCARFEAAMVAAVAAMRSHADGKDIPRPSLFGQHVETIARAVAPEGAFAKPGAKLHTALADCRDDFDWRNILIHAQGNVWIDRQGCWLWCFTFQPFGKVKATTTGTITRDEAYALEDRLKRAVDRLASHLQTLTATLSKPGND